MPFSYGMTKSKATHNATEAITKNLAVFDDKTTQENLKGFIAQYEAKQARIALLFGSCMKEFKEEINLTNLRGDLVELIKVVSDGPEEIEKFLSLIIEYGGDNFGPLKIFQSLVTFASKFKFERFLKGLAQTYSKGEIEEKHLEKLEDFLRKDINYVYISDTIQNAVKSKSLKCSMVLGCYAGEILLDYKDIEYKDTVILNALSICNDFDIDNFLKLYEYYSLKDQQKKCFRTFDDADISSILNVDIFSLENTIEKLKSVQVIGYDIGGIGNVGNAWGAFCFNKNTEIFYKVLTSAGIRNPVVL